MRVAVSRAPDAEREVSPLELFFDLVSVVAIAGIAASSAVLVAVAIADTITDGFER